MRWSLTLLSIAVLAACTAVVADSAVGGGDSAGTGNGFGSSGFGTSGYGTTGTDSYGNQGLGYTPGTGYDSYGYDPYSGGSSNGYGQSTQGYSPSDPAQRGIEAVKIAALRKYPSSNVWGYEYPYSMSYRAGTPMYVGHNYGVPSGVIYEFPGIMPLGTSEPATFYGDPEYSMYTNYGASFPFHGPVYSI